MLNDYESLSEFQDNYRYSQEYWAPFVKSAQVSTLAASGYTWSDRELKELEKEGREPIEFNIMRRPLQFFSGYLRDNLNSIVVAPVEGSDQKTADQFTKLEYHIWDKGGGYNTFLDACDEGFKSGLSLCGIHMDYTKDFVHGDISFYKRTFNSFYLDPTFTQIDLSDNAFVITRDLLGKSTVKTMLPFIDPKIIDDIRGSFRDDKFLSYHPNFSTLSRNRNLLAYDQYFRRTTRPRKFLVDEKSGFSRDITDLPKEDVRKLKMGMQRLIRLHDEAEDVGMDPKDLPANIKILDIERPYIELNVMLNGQRVYVGDDKTGIVETYPFTPILCYMEPSLWMPSQRIQGVASTLYSAQKQFNKRHMKIIDMMDSTISTGFKYLIGSVSDPSDLQQSGQSKIIGIDPENAPEGIGSVQELQGGASNSSIIEYQQILDQLTLTLANVNESVLGVDEKGNTQISGRLAEVRIAQGLRGNRKIFDNVEVSQAILGGLVLKALQNNYSPEKIKRILGEDPTSQFYEKEFEQYDAVLKEGIRSKSQRDAYYSEIVNLKREGLVDVPPDKIVEMLPTVGAGDLQDRLAEIEAQKDEQATKDRRIAEVIQEKQIAVLDATTEEKLGLAGERKSREISNLALKDERESEAQQNIAQATLDRARAISEISRLKEDRIIKVLDFVNQMENQEAAGREAQKEQVAGQAGQIESEVRGTKINEEVEASEEVEQIGKEITPP